MDFPKILFISSNGDHQSIIDELTPLLDAGLQWFQLRLKNRSKDDILNTAFVCKQLCADYNCLFTLNDNPGIAHQIDADGVHLGKNDMDLGKAQNILHESQHLGATCNTMDDAMNAYKKKANYIGVGPYAFTETKKNLSPTLGTEGYTEIINDPKYRKNIPLVAIGGLDLEAVKKLSSVGVTHFAFSSFLRGENGITNFKALQEYVGK